MLFDDDSSIFKMGIMVYRFRYRYSESSLLQYEWWVDIIGMQSMLNVFLCFIVLSEPFEQTDIFYLLFRNPHLNKTQTSNRERKGRDYNGASIWFDFIRKNAAKQVTTAEKLILRYKWSKSSRNSNKHFNSEIRSGTCATHMRQYSYEYIYE